MTRFAGKVVVVTGGGGGIGGATCATLRRARAPRSPCSISISTRRERSRPRSRRSGGIAEAFACDIADRAAVDAAVAAVEAALGPIDVLVNNAGWDVFRPFVKTEPAQWEKLIAVNLTGALHMHHAVLPGMAARGPAGSSTSPPTRRGSARRARRSTPPARAASSPSPRRIAREHARHGITVNVVCPGPTDTALFADYKEGAGNPEKLVEAFTRSIPLGRIGQPDDLPGAILFFASDDAALRHRAGAERLRRPDDGRLTEIRFRRNP